MDIIIISLNVTCSRYDMAGKIAHLVLNNNQSLTLLWQLWFHDIYRVWVQQYFSYIVAFSFIGGGNQSTCKKPQTDLPQVTDKLLTYTCSLLLVHVYQNKKITMYMYNVKILKWFTLYIHTFCVFKYCLYN